MSKRTLALGLALCLTLTACGGSPQPSPSPSAAPSAPAPTPTPQAVRAFTLPLDPAGGWDPYVGSKSSNMALVPLVCESLFSLDGSFQAQPLLAQSAQGDQDSLVWTVELRQGITFSNGQSLDAKTAAEIVNAARGGESIYAARLQGVRRVTAQEDNTLIFELKTPNAHFPALLDFPIALVDGEEVYGTGPYVVGEGKLTARGDWWRGLSLPAREIPLLETSNADALVDAFNAGKLSVVAADPTGVDALGYGGDYQSWEYTTSNMLYLGFQCGRGPCKSPDFRRAVSRALDRRTMVGQVLGGHAQTAALPAPEGSGRCDAALTQDLSWDPEGAAQTLDELGYERGEEGTRQNGRQPLKLTLLVNSDNIYKEKLARSVSGTLGELGVEVEVKALAWEEYKKALDRGEFDLYLAECRLTGDLDPGALITPGSGLCYGGFRDGELSGALAEARKTGEWGDFYTLWAQRLPLAVLCFKNAQLLTHWGQVTGASPTQGNLFYQLENWRIS